MFKINTKLLTISTKNKLAFLIISFILLFCLYHFVFLFLYQNVINQGSALADKQCLNVNPLIIARKESYIKSIQDIQETENIDGYLEESKNYIRISKEFIKTQNKWIEEQEALMSRWDYKLLMPAEIKELGKLQIRSRRADVKSSLTVLKLFEAIDEEDSQDLVEDIFKQTKIANEANEAYSRLWEKGKKPSWIDQFIKIPPSKCTEKNFNIPDVNEILFPADVPGDGPLT